jgi:hypothetical protein
LEKSLQQIGSLVGNQGWNIHQLYFVDLIINGRVVHALVDSGVSHNFLRTELASELELRVGLCRASIKALNSKDISIVGVSSTNHIQLDKWNGLVDFTILWMDDFEGIIR